MRRSPGVALALVVAAWTSAALATVQEPNGLVVPLDSQNGETQLYSLFAGRGDGVDWQTEAHPVPATFLPLCQFSATFVLKESRSSLGVGWYNATASAAPPPLSEVHEIVPAGTSVGAVISSKDIKNDPNYSGGYIGFALTGGQTHWSEAQYNPMCSGCTAPGPWILSLTYASKSTPNAYYLAFEDGSVTSAQDGFANDGDFNDYVFFFSGLVCSGGGSACDTGQPGRCQTGLSQCDGSGNLTCKPVLQPTTETCDGVDDDCNGQVDEGDLCPAGQVCDKGACVKSCGGGEFQCPSNKTCAGGFCVDPACATVTCPAGEVCTAGACHAPCDGVSCPAPTLCRAGVCVDACAGLVCDAGQVCVDGACMPSCACLPCGAGLACDDASGRCMAPACVGRTCPSGETCDGASGLCVDACLGATCPSGQACEAGACVDVAIDADAGDADAGDVDGGGFVDGGFGGAGGAGGSGGSGAGHHVQNASGYNSTDGSCGCRVAGRSASRGAQGGLGVALAFALALVARRRVSPRRAAARAARRARGRWSRPARR